MQHTLLFANEVLNTITAGTYTIRPLLFLGYFLGLSILVLLFDQIQKKTRKPLLNAHWIRIISSIAIGSFSLLFLINIVLQISVFSRFGIPEQNVAVGIYKGEITNTRLIHTHFGKVIVAEALSTPTKDLVLRSDTGRALLPYVPVSIVIFEILLLCIGLSASGIASAFRVHAVRGKSQRICMMALLGILGFLVFEKSVDGGIFSDGAGFALVAYAYLLLAPLKQCKKAYPYIAIGYIWILLGLYSFGFYWPLAYFTDTFERLVILLLLISTLMAGIHSHWRHVTVLGVATLFSMSLFMYHNDMSDRAYLGTPITRGSQYVSVYPEEAQPALPKIGSIGEMNVYDASALVSKEISAVLDMYHLPMAYRPVTEGEYICAKPAILKEEKFSVLTPSTLTDVRSKGGLFSIEVIRVYPAPAGWNRYEGKILYNPCISRYLDVLEQGIKAAGSSSALIYNLELYTTPNPQK